MRGVEAGRGRAVAGTAQRFGGGLGEKGGGGSGGRGLGPELQELAASVSWQGTRPERREVAGPRAATPRGILGAASGECPDRQGRRTEGGTAGLGVQGKGASSNEGPDNSGKEKVVAVRYRNTDLSCLRRAGGRPGTQSGLLQPQLGAQVPRRDPEEQRSVARPAKAKGALSRLSEQWHYLHR